MTSPPGVAVVMVEYFSGGLTARRVEEAIEVGYAAVVADNSGAYEGPGAVVPTGGNVGFGVANNIAVEALDPGVSIIVLINPDVVILPEHLGALVELVARGEWAMVAPATVTPEGERFGFADPGSSREVLVTARAWAGSHLGADVTRFRSGRRSRTASGSVWEPAGRFGSAALLVVSRKAFESVGGFDDRYFLYVEDADLWDRMRSRGFRVGFDPSAKLEHLAGSGSLGTAGRRAALRRLGIETYLETRGRSFTAARLAHRAVPVQMRKGERDPIIEAIRSGYRASCRPTEIQRRVREVALSERPEQAP